MAHVVAAAFTDFTAAEAALDALRGQGIAPSHLSMFYPTAEGRHAQLPLEGDRLDAAAGAAKGAALGGAAGLALGFAAVPVVGPVAATIGGLAAGSLAGAVSDLGKDDAPRDAPKERPVGVVVAVNVPTPAERERATSIFWRHHAHSIEVAEGTWRNGTWQDFDPVSIPRWRKAPAA